MSFTYYNMFQCTQSSNCKHLNLTFRRLKVCLLKCNLFPTKLTNGHVKHRSIISNPLHKQVPPPPQILPDHPFHRSHNDNTQHFLLDRLTV